MSHLEKDIIKGKFGKNPKLKEEAAEELEETKKGREDLKKFVAKRMVSHKIEKAAEQREKRHQRGEV